MGYAPRGFLIDWNNDELVTEFTKALKEIFVQLDAVKCGDFTDEELENACRMACAHDFVSAFPDGYDTFVGERGVKLSGGQKQRISIARALMKDANILILDDAVSAVDLRTEQAILENLRRIRKGKTTILIAHRISTVEKMDKIIHTIMDARSNVLYFCGAGKDRTGVVSAVILRKLGCSDRIIIKDYMKTKDNLMGFLTSYVAEHPEVDINTIIPNENNIKRVLEAL